jgi:hypothetical protein
MHGSASPNARVHQVRCANPVTGVDDVLSGGPCFSRRCLP